MKWEGDVGVVGVDVVIVVWGDVGIDVREV